MYAPNTCSADGQDNKKKENDLATVKAVEEADLNSAPHFLNVRAVLMRVNTKKDLWYNACPEDGVNAKV